MGSARVSRAGFGVAPKQSLLGFPLALERSEFKRKVRDREDAPASTRNAGATQTGNGQLTRRFVSRSRAGAPATELPTPGRRLFQQRLRRNGEAQQSTRG
jgi:hypothetical protein